MLRRRAALLSMVAVAAWSAVAADAPAPSDRIAEGFRAPDKGARILVLPVGSPDPRYASGGPRIEQALLAGLEKMGFAPVAFKGSKFESVWPEIVRQVEATAEPKDRGNVASARARAVGTLAKIVSADADYAMTLSPVIAVRRVALESDFTTWDGVRRSPPAVIKDGMQTWARRFKGTTLGLSLQLAGYGTEGRWAFTSFGGMTLPGEANYDTGKMTIRTDLFEDKAEIEEGVAVALRPLERH